MSEYEMPYLDINTPTENKAKNLIPAQVPGHTKNTIVLLMFVIMLMVAVILAVGTGILVYFVAGGSKEIKVVFPENYSPTCSSSKELLDKESTPAAPQGDTTTQPQDVPVTQKPSENSTQSPVHSTGVVYVRWGRNTCPGTAELIYKGFIGGKHYNTEGSGTNNLCLPSDPTWSSYVDGNDGTYRGFIYGTEIDNWDANVFEHNVNNQDMPCSVCRTQKELALMVPARKDCYPGWTIEYNGYLMGANSRKPGSYDYICMDHQPEFLQSGSTDDNQHILYLIEAQCGSLPCPPYVQGRELACVVCSK